MAAAFDDGKAAGALRTIGEVSAALGIRTHVLRYWEERFPALRPLKRSGNRRYYRPCDVALIETIDRLLNREGYTIKGAQAALAAGPAAPPAVPEGPGAPATVPAPEILAELRDIRDRLRRALEA